ncbi:Uncharacterised protein [Candidatus Gugararchaeum adminiculabundum]|nr:Uncharacterised protein [Candidatus Gugararchaeum adminiculabundum]
MVFLKKSPSSAHLRKSASQSVHSPTLETILMVEETLKNADESLLTIAELKRLLPRQVNHNTLRAILLYLESGNKIVVSLKGITWVYNDNPNLNRIIATGRRL